jgi:hypothetical protein
LHFNSLNLHELSNAFKNSSLNPFNWWFILFNRLSNLLSGCSVAVTRRLDVDESLIVKEVGLDKRLLLINLLDAVFGDEGVL